MSGATEYQIVEVTGQDQEGILKCAKKVRAEMNWHPITKEKSADLFNVTGTYIRNAGNFWVIKSNNHVIGMCGLEDVGNSRGVVRRFYLDSSYQGMGLGKNIFETMVSYAKTKGFKTLYLGTSPDAVAANVIYKKFGFEKIEALPTDINYYGEEYFKLDLAGEK